MRRVFMKLLMLGMTVAATAQTDGLKPVEAGLLTVKDFGSQRVTRAASSRQGVKATLKYEQIADMATPRMGHQLIPSGEGFVAVGGRTTGFELTKTAELYLNGSWKSVYISNTHDGAFSVRLPDGRYMVGGGFASSQGIGQSRFTDIYDPQTRTFIAGPLMTTARAQAQAVVLGGKVYVSGNWYADDQQMDVYDGSSFSAVGIMDGRTKPYMMYDAAGNPYVMSPQNNNGGSFGYYTETDGSQLLLCDKFFVSEGETRYFKLPFNEQLLPLPLPDDIRSSDYHIIFNGNNCYLMLVKTPTGYLLYMMDLDEGMLYRYTKFVIPTVDDAGATITWRGGVLTNEARKELYLIGASGAVTNQTLHVVSLNYTTDEWTIASASGFRHNMLSASWTLMNDGRLACTGGGIKDNTDAQTAAYIITPTTAGMGDAEQGADDLVDRKVLVVETKDHVQTTYLLWHRPQVRFEGDNLRVVSTTADVTYKLSDILRFTYETRTVSGIRDVSQPAPELGYDADGTLVVSQLPKGANVCIYSLDGKLVGQLTAAYNGTFRISLATLPQGVYLVKADNTTYKIMKR